MPSAPIFIENRGQFDPKVRFQVKIGSKTAWLTDKGVVFDAVRATQVEKLGTTAEPDAFAGRLALPRHSTSTFDHVMPGTQTTDRLVFTEDFVGLGCCSKVEGSEPRPGVYNYFQSSDPAKWRTNVRGYGAVIYREVWPHIDLRIYGNGPDLEQEFIVHPDADPNQVQIAFRGIDRLNVSQDGSLEVHTAFGTLGETKPRIYQQIAGKQVKVDGRFKLTSDSAYAFEVEPHNAQYALVIDPTLLYSTYLGGSAGNSPYSSNNEVATGIAVDASGNAYVAGYTQSTDFPTTPGAFQTSPGTGQISFITKLNATGSALIYSTYLSLSAASVNAIAVDISGNAYVTGAGTDGTFPITPNAAFPTCSGRSAGPGDGFITVLNSGGNGLLSSSCFNRSGNYNGFYFSSNGVAIDTSIFQSKDEHENGFQPGGSASHEKGE